jgi:hypothetical protein
MIFPAAKVAIAFIGLLVTLAGASLCVAAEGSRQASKEAELVGIASLPADVFVGGPVSGQFIQSEEGSDLADILPFSLGQPLQGFSAVTAEGDGRFLVLADNGYGSRQNSADFILTLYRIRPDFKTQAGGTGSITVESSIQLSDPQGHAPFERVADLDQIQWQDKSFTVDSLIKNQRLLTGADFDPESLQTLDDGSFWVGEEFGPWLLHFDRVGRLLQPPVALPGISSPNNVLIENPNPRAASSGGFEGMAMDAGVLYPMIEKPLVDDAGHLLIKGFDPKTGEFIDSLTMRYPLDPGASGVGAIQSLGDGGFLAIERDSGEGESARIKRIYRIDRGRTDNDGVLIKTLLVDLLNIRDPHNLAEAGAESLGQPYRFSYHTIESLVIMGPDTLGVLNDNNYPFGDGPDGTEGTGPEKTVFIVLKLDSFNPWEPAR